MINALFTFYKRYALRNGEEQCYHNVHSAHFDFLFSDNTIIQIAIVIHTCWMRAHTKDILEYTLYKTYCNTVIMVEINRKS